MRYKENTLFSAKNVVKLGHNVKIGKGVSLKMAHGNISIIVTREDDILCGWQYPNYLYWGDTWQVSVKNVNRFNLYIYNRYGQTVIRKSNIGVNFDGEIDVWDSNEGGNVNRSESIVLYFVLELYDTIGNKHEKKGFFHCYPT